MTANELVKELNEVLCEEPWYGSSVMTLIDKVDPEKAHDKSRGPHSIADILMHMIAWTEETTERLKGKLASDPARGDWPDPSKKSWRELTALFVAANEHLKDTIVKMDEDIFQRAINDDRYPEIAEKVSNGELIKGIIQHHIYHSAQIAILNK